MCALTSKHAADEASMAGTAFEEKLTTATTWFSFATNVLGTACITLQAWYVSLVSTHRRSLNDILRRHLKLSRLVSRRKGEVTRILLLLVEIGVVFAVIQVSRSIA